MCQQKMLTSITGHADARHYLRCDKCVLFDQCRAQLKAHLRKSINRFVMDIEFHAPEGKVKQWLIDHIRNELLELHRRERGISRATITFSEESADSGTAKACSADLYIFGDSIFVRRVGDTYEQASREVLEELYSRIDERMLNKNEPPEELTSSVSI